MAASLVGLPAHALDPNRSITQFNHTGWAVRDGAPANVIALAQTPDGYLWLGSPAGLYRFDGVRFQAIARRISVNALTVTKSGDLWIGADTGVGRLTPDGSVKIAMPPVVTPGPIRLMASGPDGSVWIATDSQVARFDGRRWQVMQADWGSSDAWSKPTGVWGLAVARDSVVWAKNSLDLYYLRPGSTQFVKADGYSGGGINFARAADGRLWTTDRRLNRFYALPDLAPSKPLPPPAQIGAPVPPGILAWALLDRDGSLWVANQATGGVYRARSVTGPARPADSFFPKDGLTNIVPTSICEDREGDVWVGTGGGLDRFAPANVVIDPAITIRGQRQAMSASAAAVYLADGWASPAPGFGHNVETVYRIAEGSAQALPIQGGNVDALFALRDDTLLVGRGPRLFQRRGGLVSEVALPAEAHGARVSATAATDGELWVTLVGKGVFRRRAGVWARLAPPGITFDDDAGLAVDPQGAVWIIQSKTDVAVRVLGDHVDIYPSASGPNVGKIFAAAPDGDGLLFGGQFGVARFDGRGFHTLTEAQAPWLTSIGGIVFDDDGGTWFSTAVGIYRVSTARLEQALRDPKVRLDAQLFDARDGLRSTATLERFGNEAARGPDGRLWFATIDTLASIDPRHLYRNLVPPPVSVQSITTEGRVFDPRAASRLPAGASNLQIDYTALSLQTPRRVRFRYQLEGVDKGWVDAGDRRQAFYTRLGPGRYRFRVIAANNDGVWNTTGATADFGIPPTFVQSGWFLLLCALIAVLLLWAAYVWRLRQATAAIQSRLEERVAERERIARELHDTLLQGFQGLVLRLDAIMQSLPRGGPARAQMEAALERADEVLVSGRDHVRQLRTRGNEELSEALVTIAEAAAEASSAEFKLTVEGAPRPLHPIVAEELAAIGREAIHNAFQHAHASNIDAVLTYDRRAVALRVADDGRGVDAGVLAAGGREGHFGLTGMRERAEKIEAKFQVSSRPGAGCEIEVTAPARIAYASLQDEPLPVRQLRRLAASIALLFGAKRPT